MATTREIAQEVLTLLQADGTKIEETPITENIGDVSTMLGTDSSGSMKRITPENLFKNLRNGMGYNGYVTPDTTLPVTDNVFYLANSQGDYVDADGQVVTISTNGVTLIQRKNGEWKTYALWELVDDLNNASSTRFASAKAVKLLKDMIDQLAAQGGGGGGGGSVIVDSELSETSLNPVQNAVITAALNELGEAIEEATAKNSVTTDKIADYAVTDEKLSFELSNKIDNTKIVADKAAADIGADNITLLQGGIDPDGKENTSSYYLRTSRSSTFKLGVNNGYTIGQLAQYDLAGNFVALYNDYTQIEGVEWTPTSVVATDKDYMWVAIVFKGNSPTVAIYPREDVVKTFVSGLHYYMQGGEGDPQSTAAQAKAIAQQVTATAIDNLPNEEDLTLGEDGKMQLANRNAEINDDKVSSLGYVILRKEKSFAGQVTEPNCIYEIRYEFDLNGKEVEIPANSTLKFNGGKINNGTLKGKETTIEAQLSQILNSVILKGTWANDYFYPEWLGANGDDNINDTDAIQLLINAEVNIKLLAKKYKANVTWNSRSAIIGSGQDKTILEPFDNSKPVILVDVQTNTSSYAPLAYTNRILSDLTIHSGIMDSVVAVPTGVGVQMSVEGGKSNVGVIELTRCAIVGFEYGVKKSYGGLGGNVVNCNFDKNDFHYYAYATASTSHSGCTLFHKNHFMRSYKAAIYIEYTAAIGGGQDVFDNNIFEHNRGFIFFIKGFKSSTTEMRITNNWFEENSLGNFVEKNPNDISIYDFAPVEINGETYDLAEIYLESSSGIVVENCLLRALTLKSSKITLDSVTPTTSQRYNIPREFVLIKDNNSEVLYKNAVCGTSVIETIVDSQIKLGLSTGSVATNIVADSIKNMPAGRTPSIFRVKNKTRKKALVNSVDSSILASSVAGVLPFSYNYSTSMPALNGSWKQMTVIEDDSLLNKNYNRAIITAGNTGGFLRGCSVTLDSNIFNYYVIVLSVKSDNPTSPLYIAFGNNAGVWINANDITSEWQTFAVLCNATNWRTVERTGNIVVYTGKYGSAEVTEELVLDISYLNVIGFNKAEDALSYVNGDYIIDNDMTAEIGTYNTLPTQVTTGKQVYDKDLSKPVIWDGTEWSDALDRKANNVDESKPMGMGYKVLSPNKSFSEQVTAANTIYEIRYNFDLGGETVTLKEGCTLKFVGGKLSNGRLAGANLRFDYYDSNGDGDSLPDLIDMLENCLPISYTGGTVTSFINIYLGYGRYVIDRPIRFKNYGKRFALIGKGVSKTTVEVTIPDEEIENVAAFVNKKETIDGVTYHGFGFSTFKDILFEGGSKQVFMDVDTGTDYGVPQNFKFVDCAFTKFKRIVRTKGDVMASEFFFRGTNIYAMDEDSVAFEFDNHESVNFMFSQCCIESLKGKLFYVNKGTFINVQQSSIIMDGSNAALVYTNETSQPNTLTMGTIFDGCRFEIRNGAKLLDLHNNYKMYISIVNCRLGINSANTVAMTLGANTHLHFVGNDSIGQTSIVELANTALTQYQGVIITDNKSLFNAVINSETFKQMAPSSIGVTYRIIYNGKVYKLPYDYPSAALSEDGGNTYDNSEIKSESISFTYQKGGITDLYPYDSEEKRVVTRTINRFVTDLQVVLKKSSQIGSYKYRLEFELLKSDTVVKSFTIENKGNIEKIVRVYVGEEIDTIKCTRYNDDITTGSARGLIGFINVNYR